MKCRVCGTFCREFLDLGRQPIANNFLSYDTLSAYDKARSGQSKQSLQIHPSRAFYQLEDGEYEPSYNLTIHFCPGCLTIQIDETPDMSKVFNEDYAFYTGTSQSMIIHFAKLAAYVKETFFVPIEAAGNRPVLVEIGTNDGTFLQHFADPDSEFKQPVAIGFEPSKGVAAVAKSRGIRICSERFEDHDFDSNLGHWPATDVIVSSNTFAHIPDRKGVLSNIKKIMAPGGVWINEEPYFGKVVENLAFDQFYNEHIYYTTIASMQNVLTMHNMTIRGLEFLWTHGGSIRYYIGHLNSFLPEWATKVPTFYSMSKENFFNENLHDFSVLEQFAREVRVHIQTFGNFLHDFKGELVGYGASAKSSTVLNACGRGAIDRIYDNTPAKQGKFSPGKHVPIVPSSTFQKDDPKDVVNFAWNHMKEILMKEKGNHRTWYVPVKSNVVSGGAE